VVQARQGAMPNDHHDGPRASSPAGGRPRHDEPSTQGHPYQYQAAAPAFHHTPLPPPDPFPGKGGEGMGIWREDARGRSGPN
jgi:hypothetical protein